MSGELIRIDDSSLAELRRQAGRAPLADLESTIAENLHSVALVAVALAAIHERALYKETHRSFAAYCLDRWGISESTAYRQLAVGKAVRDKTAGQRLPRAGGLPSQRSLSQPKGKIPAAHAARGEGDFQNRAEPVDPAPEVDGGRAVDMPPEPALDSGGDLPQGTSGGGAQGRAEPANERGVTGVGPTGPAATAQSPPHSAGQMVTATAAAKRLLMLDREAAVHALGVLMLAELKWWADRMQPPPSKRAELSGEKCRHPLIRRIGNGCAECGATVAR